MSVMRTHQRALFWFALALQAIGAFVYFVLAEGSGHANAFYGLTKVMMLLLPLLWISTGAKLPKLLKKTDQWWTGLVIGIVFAGLLIGGYWLLQDVVANGQEAIAAKISDFGIGSFVLFAVVFSIVHSLFEEYYWRWFVLGAGKKIVGASAVLISSAAFGLHHIIILSQLFPLWFALTGGAVTMLAGWIWCQMTLKSGSILPAWLSHLFADAAIMYIGWQLL